MAYGELCRGRAVEDSFADVLHYTPELDRRVCEEQCIGRAETDYLQLRVELVHLDAADRGREVQFDCGRLDLCEIKRDDRHMRRLAARRLRSPFHPLRQRVV